VSEFASTSDPRGDVAFVLTTLPDLESGENFVRTLVEERLIACGNLLDGVVSVYRWEGRVVRESEVLVLMKSGASNVAGLFDRIREIHPYSVPEVVELPVGAVARAYSEWVMQSTR
jgi:periplasmic divalent cation tolerance protein